MTGMGVIQVTCVFTRGTGAVGVNLEVTSTARRRMIIQVQRLALLRRHRSRHWGVLAMTGMGVIQATCVFTRGTGAVGVNLEVTSTARRRVIVQVSVSLSSDGTVVAIGAYYNDGNGSDSGHVRIYAVGREQLESTWR